MAGKACLSESFPQGPCWALLVIAADPNISPSSAQVCLLMCNMVITTPVLPPSQVRVEIKWGGKIKQEGTLSGVQTLLPSVLVSVISSLVMGISGIPQTKPSLSRVFFSGGNHYFSTSANRSNLKVWVMRLQHIWRKRIHSGLSWECLVYYSYRCHLVEEISPHSNPPYPHTETLPSRVCSPISLDKFFFFFFLRENISDSK